MAVAGGAPCTVSLAYAYRIYEKELCEGHGGVHKAFTGNIGRLGPRYILYIPDERSVQSECVCATANSGGQVTCDKF